MKNYVTGTGGRYYYYYMVKDGKERDYVAVVPSDRTVPVNGV